MESGCGYGINQGVTLSDQLKPSRSAATQSGHKARAGQPAGGAGERQRDRWRRYRRSRGLLLLNADLTNVRCVVLLDFMECCVTWRRLPTRLTRIATLGIGGADFIGIPARPPRCEPGWSWWWRLDRLGWRYAVSAIRPAGYRPMVGRWLGQHLGGCRGAEWSHVSETLGRSAADNKRAHWVEAMVSRHAPVCPLFVDDEPAVVDELIARGVPAMGVEELAGLSDSDRPRCCSTAPGGSARAERRCGCIGV